MAGSGLLAGYALTVPAGCAAGAVVHRWARAAVGRYVASPPGAWLVFGWCVLALGAAAAAAGPHWHVLALLWAAAFGVPLALVDLAEKRLPDRLTYPSAAGTLLLLGVAALSGDRTGSPLGATYGALGLGAVFWLMGLALPVGLGDAKLALTIGAVLGWYGARTLVEGVLLSFVLAGLYGTGKLVARRAGRRDELPFGPFLLLGTLAAVALTGG